MMARLMYIFAAMAIAGCQPARVMNLDGKKAGIVEINPMASNNNLVEEVEGPTIEQQIIDLKRDLANERARSDAKDNQLRKQLNAEEEQRREQDEQLSARITILEESEIEIRSSLEKLESDIGELDDKYEEEIERLDAVDTRLANRIGKLETAFANFQKQNQLDQAQLVKMFEGSDQSLKDELTNLIEAKNSQLNELMSASAQEATATLNNYKAQISKKLQELVDSDEEQKLNADVLLAQIRENSDALSIQIREQKAFKIWVNNNFATKEELDELQKNLKSSLRSTTSMLLGKIDSGDQALKDAIAKYKSENKSKLQIIAEKISGLQAKDNEFNQKLRDTKKEIFAEIDSLGSQVKIDIKAIVNDLKKNQKTDAQMQKNMNKVMSQVVAHAELIRTLNEQLNQKTKNLQEQINEIENSNKSLAGKELVSSLKDKLIQVRKEMLDIIETEQEKRKMLTQEMNTVQKRLAQIERTAMRSLEMTKINAEKIKILGSEFNNYKKDISGKFKAAEKDVDDKLKLLKNSMVDKMEKLHFETMTLLENQESGMAADFAKLACKVATLSSRVTGHEDDIKNLSEKIDGLGLKGKVTYNNVHQYSQEMATRYANLLYAYGDLQNALIQELAPNQDAQAAYHQSFRPVMNLCGGNTKATFPNALGIDSFQYLVMEFQRLLVFGGRSENKNIDKIFFDIDPEDFEDDLFHSLMIRSTDYSIASKAQGCEKKIKNWGRIVWLEDATFQQFREKIADSSNIERKLMQVLAAIEKLKKQSTHVDKILTQVSEESNVRDILAKLYAHYTLNLHAMASASAVLADKSVVFNQYLQVQKELATNQSEFNNRLDNIQELIKEIAADTDARIDIIESRVGSLEDSVKMTLNILLTIVDREGHNDLVDDVVKAAKSIDHKPVLIGDYSPKIFHIQTYFDNPEARKNQSSTCTGSNILSEVQLDRYTNPYSFRSECWVNYRWEPTQKSFNKASSLWWRIHAAGNGIELKVDESIQKGGNFSNYNYEKTFWYFGDEYDQGIVTKRGEFSNGVVDIKTPNLLTKFIQQVRSWYGIQISLTALKKHGDSVTRSKTHQYKIQLYSPIILDFYPNGRTETLALNQSSPLFDLDGDGTREQVGWFNARESGLLAIDLNGDGKINSGKELFGQATEIATGVKAKNGYHAMAKYDSNQDGFLDAHDAKYSELLVWQDFNQNGESEANELVSVVNKGIERIKISYEDVAFDQKADNGNSIEYKSLFFTKSGPCKNGCNSYDIFFAKSSRVGEY